MHTDPDCPFCTLPPDRVLRESPHARALADAHPVTEGHTLVVSKRHTERLFDLPAAELDDVWRLVAAVRRDLEQRLSADGFTIGINDGQAAGQTVSHAHVHVIPRRAGDVTDARGGIRWVVPEAAPYWDE